MTTVHGDTLILTREVYPRRYGKKKQIYPKQNLSLFFVSFFFSPLTCPFPAACGWGGGVGSWGGGGRVVRGGGGAGWGWGVACGLCGLV